MSVSGSSDRFDVNEFLRPEFRTEAHPQGLESSILSGGEMDAVARGEQTLSLGAKGPAVKRLQQALFIRGHELTDDGDFGAKTASALKIFQRNKGLPATGTLDRATLLALDKGIQEDGFGADVRAAPVSRGSTPARPQLPTSGFETFDGGNWFTDVDELEAPAGTRDYLDRALRGGDKELIRVLPGIELFQASPKEKATLVSHLLRGNPPTKAEQQWIVELLQKDEKVSREVVRELGFGKLSQLFRALDKEPFGKVLRMLPGIASEPGLAATIVGALGTRDTDQRRLGMHHVLDRARRDGFLDDATAGLQRAFGGNKVVADIIGQAYPTREPVIVAHRGLTDEVPENTLEAVKLAVEGGANGIEIDVTITKDGELALWHDYTPGNIVAVARNFGLESTNKWRPILPDIGHPARGPVHDIDLATLRATHGYAPRSAGIGTSQRAGTIPTLDDIARYAKAHPELERIVVDVKLPNDRPDLHRRFAQQAEKILDANGLKDRVILLHNNADVVKNLKAEMPEYRFSYDVEIVSLLPDADDYSAVASARRLGNDVASVGRPVIGKDGYDVYLEVLKKDRKAIDASGKPTELVAWTINDELEMREIMAIGVDGILTDKPELLERVLEAYGMR